MVQKFEATFAEQGQISDAALTEARSWIGKKLRLELWNTEASRDGIRHFALGLGDLNQLWSDPAYGKNSVHGTTIAPPTFLYSVFECALFPGLPGLMAFRRSAEWTFHDVVRLGDQLDAEAYPVDAMITSSKTGAKRLRQFNKTIFYRTNTPEREKVAEVVHSVIRSPQRGSDPNAVAFSPRVRTTYSEQQLEEIQGRYDRVQIRGAEPRYWDDVAVGDDIPEIVKGPYTRMSMVAYYIGAPGSPGYRAHDAWWRNRRYALHAPENLPNTIPSSYFAGTGVTSLGHHDESVALQTGMPGVYDNGNQRTSIISTCVTHWMGDLAFLSTYSIDVRLPVIEGDLMTVGGRVVGKDTDVLAAPFSRPGSASTGFSQVTLELYARNQLDQTVSSGRATVLLPRR